MTGRTTEASPSYGQMAGVDISLVTSDGIAS
jgi:hypothetical protein